MSCLRDAWRSTIDNLKFLTMKKYFLIITAICLSCAALMAEPVSKQKALQIASQVMDAKNGMKKAPALNTLKAEAVFGKVDTKGNPYLYAVCGKESGGYVLVSGDDGYAEVLGYSDEGQFEADNMPDAMREWVMGYIETIRELDAKGFAPARVVHDTPSWPAILPMTSTLWYQLMPYCNNLPMINGLPSVTGCSTTAVAQLINYWAKKTGQPAGTTSVIPAYQTKSGIQMEELPVTTFDWSKIIDDYASGATDEQEAEVAKLFLYVACALKVEFGTTVSGGSSDEDKNVIPALTGYFGFDQTATFEQRTRYSLADWTELVYNELSHQRPVLCGAGNGAGVGHAFLVDGYDGDGMFHVNWGWSGRSNGYYRMSVLDPSSIDDWDAPVSNTSFQNALCALIGAQIGMEQPAEMVPPSVLWGDMTIEGTTLSNVAINMEKDNENLLLPME